MATVTRGYSFGSTEQVTNTKLHSLVDSATVTAILNADVDAGAAISDTKLDLATIAQAMQFNGAITFAATSAFSSVAENWAKGSDIASAATTDIGAATGNFVDITGTTTITGLGTVQAGTWRAVKFAGALTLTHNASSLFLPNGGSNITTAANDTAIFVSLGSGNWRCLSYQYATGSSITVSNALSGSIIQVVNFQTGASAAGSTSIPNDDSIPQNTEGDQYMSAAITPNNASNKLIVDVVFHGTEATNTSDITTVALFQDSTAGALAASQNTPGTAVNNLSFRHFMSAGTTASTTFKVRAGLDTASPLNFNGVASAQKMGGVMASSITIWERKA